MRKFIIILLFCFVLPTTIFAMQPPAEGDMQKYIEDGTYDKRMETAKRIGNYKTNLTLPETSGDIKLFSLPPAYSYYMPSTGEVRMALIMVEFVDEKFADGDKANYELLMNGAQNPGSTCYPYESLQAYYKRSSYGKLNITTDVYKCSIPFTRAEFTSNKDLGNNNIYTMVKYIMDTVNTPEFDFTKYDNINNGQIDGTIDGLSFVWAGDDEGWASNIWWSMMADYPGTSFGTCDGKNLKLFTWFASNHVPPNGGTVNVAIHETGHLLGLPDYYDYNEFYGPDGGLGGMDMMDRNKGDHNSFSKYLLGWVTPTVITTDTTTPIDLKALSDTSGLESDTRAIIVGNSGANNINEYYLIEYRKTMENDKGYSSLGTNGGVAIWHVKAEISSLGDFVYDNSYASYKLLSLVEADGLEQIEQGYSVKASSLYGIGKDFGVNTFPTSDKYDRTPTGVNVKVNGFTSNSASISISFANDNVAPELTNSFLRETPSMSATPVHFTYSSDVYEGTGLIEFTTSNGVSIGGTIRTYKNNAYFLPERQLLPSEEYILTVPKGVIVDASDNSASETYTFKTPDASGVSMETIKVKDSIGLVGECSTFISVGKILTASVDLVDSKLLWLTVTENGVIKDKKYYQVINQIVLIKSIIPISDGYLLTYQLGNNYVLVKFDKSLNYIDEEPVAGEQVHSLAEIDGYYLCFGKYSISKHSTSTLNYIGDADIDCYEQYELININNAIATSDGGFLLVGQNISRNMRVVKLNNLLVEEWSYNDTVSSKGMSVVETSSGYAVLKLANYVTNNAIYEANAYITRLTFTGGIVTTSSTLGVTVFTSYRIPQMKVDSNDDIYVSLYTNRSQEPQKPYCYVTDGYYTKGFDNEVIKISLDNSILWRRSLPGSIGLGSSPMLCGTNNLIMTAYDEIDDCLLLYNLKSFGNPELIEQYSLIEGNNTKSFATIKNTKSINSSPMLAIGEFNEQKVQSKLIMDISPSIQSSFYAPLSVEHTKQLSSTNKIYLFDDTASIKPLK